MNRYSFFHKDTGAIAQHVYAASPPELAINTPADHIPLEGAFDPHSQRVDLEKVKQLEAEHASAHAEHVERLRAAHVEAGKPLEEFKAPAPPTFTKHADAVVDYIPQQPSAEHEWRADLRRWHLTPAAIALRNRQAEARLKIAALLEEQHHLVRGVLLGRSCRDELQAIEDQIAELRKDLSGTPPDP